MKIGCQDRERVLRDQEPEALAALAHHAETCAACAEELRAWNEISLAAKALRKTWPSPELWLRIRQALAEQAVAGQRAPVQDWRRLFETLVRQWQTAAALAALLVVSLSGAWILLRAPRGPSGVPQSAEEKSAAEKRILTEQAVREVEQREAAHLESIGKLSKLAEPRIAQPTSPLLMSYREKLMLLDAAIAECRANIEQNRGNTHLRNELLAMLREKQRTLEEVVREE